MPPRPPSSTVLLRRVAVALYVLAVLRVLLVVVPLPMRGYANNYDFIRIAAWFDLWPVAPHGVTPFDPLAQHPRAPLRCHQVDHAITSEIRYPSTELAFVWLALRANDAWRAISGPAPCELDLRVLGLLRAVVLLAAGAAIVVAFFRRAPVAGVWAAAMLALVLADPALTLLLNTLYSDFSTVLATYVACALVVYAISFAAWSTTVVVALTLVLPCLAMTKTQYAGLPVLLCGVLALGAARRRGVTPVARLLPVALATAGALAGLLLQRHLLATGGGYLWAMRMGAATDTFFGAVLPLHRDPDRALALIGLPERCRPYVGRTWYDDGMQPPPCPEVGDVSRLAIARLLLDDPALGARLAARALPLLQPLVVRYLGQVEGADRAQADAGWRGGIVSLSTPLERLPGAVFALLVAGSLLAAPLALIDLLRRDAPPLLPALVLVCATVEAYAFTTSLVGAGFIGLARHSLPGQLALLVLLVAAPVQIGRELRRLGDGRVPLAGYSV